MDQTHQDKKAHQDKALPVGVHKLVEVMPEMPLSSP